MSDSNTILKIDDLHTHYDTPQGTVRAVAGTSLEVHRGETVGIVGESGCGKSVMLRSILRIVPHPGRIIGGSIEFTRRDGETVDMVKLDPNSRKIRSIRGDEIAMIFQEPMSSLSPVHTIGDQIIEAIVLHKSVSNTEARSIAIEMLGKVAMPRPEQIVDQYPHEISGGMRQRAMIAMALSCEPRLLIADEPTTALDVTTQAQILDLMRRLQSEFNMAIMFVTHDLGVVAQMTEHVVVMYMGQVVEAGSVKELFTAPRHPYTHGLLHSIPRLGQRKLGRRLVSIKGSVPDPFARPSGCPFHTRCQYNDGDRCVREEPALREVMPGHSARCHYAETLGLQGVDKPAEAINA
ncbi:dipeptide/oligopeptide/nickel ABC transporter ATP-binding protein [Devosia pacifica]|uniref:Dipeptide/oligopeptide/nickel ABC transporter ATP-binding protein n=1 Tax=Devosia pacifica TaxID=1335967 RepID=A0A918SE51_9HYPH|nr:ABC transporter ATP-binding protein [Devosia pacifica]GHA35730.1 dipeptide/oligopeptide/nickel ABC transporter ATP-binding protein [Devosia pacifica]